MGLVHIYHGDGKGKTTAAIGLVVRAKGAGHDALFQQYLKDGKSSEICILESLGITVDSGQPESASGFTWEMNQEQMRLLREYQNERLERAFTWLESHTSAGVIVLDEVLASITYDLIEESRILDLVKEVKSVEDGPDIVLTGRNPGENILRMADYISEIKAIKHPFDQGIIARKGIEF